MISEGLDQNFSFVQSDQSLCLLLMPHVWKLHDLAQISSHETVINHFLCL